MFDKFHEECGVFGIYRPSRGGQPRLPRALRAAAPRPGERRHRRLGRRARCAPCARWATSPRSSTQDALGDAARAPSPSATPATRPPARARLANAQPLLIDCVHGQVGICHNGNIVNARELRDELVRAGLDLPDQQRHRGGAAPLRPVARPLSVDDALVESIAQLTGAFSLAFVTKDRLIAVARPARVPAAGPRAGSATRWVVCSETCALDLIGATYVRDVEPGEVLIIGPDGPRSVRPFPPAPQRALRLRARLLRPPRQRGLRAERQRRAHRASAASWRAKPRCRPTSSCRFPTPASAPPSATPRQSGMPMRMGLIRNHYVGRTFIEPAQSIRHFGVKVKLNPVRSLLEGQRVVLIDDSIVRGTTSRKIVKMVRAAGAARGARAHQLPADDLAVLLRRRHAAAQRADRRDPLARRDPQVPGRRFGGVSEPRRAALDGDPRQRPLLHVVLHRPVSGGVSAETSRPICNWRSSSTAAPRASRRPSRSHERHRLQVGRRRHRRRQRDGPPHQVDLRASTFTPGVLSEIGSFGGLFTLARRRLERPGAGVERRRRRHQAEGRVPGRRARHHRPRPGEPLRERHPGAGGVAAVLPRLPGHRPPVARRRRADRHRAGRGMP